MKVGVRRTAQGGWDVVIVRADGSEYVLLHNASDLRAGTEAAKARKCRYVGILPKAK